MKYKIGVYGSGAGDMTAAKPMAEAIGRALGGHANAVIVITGACTGLPYIAAYEAAQQGCEVWGFASSLNLKELAAEYPDDDLTIYNKIIYVPPNFVFAKEDRIRKKYRNIVSTASCDAAIFISGRWGTMNEFTNLIDFGKTAGVLTGSGGMADELPALTKKISKTGQGEVIFNDNPKQLIGELLKSIRSN